MNEKTSTELRRATYRALCKYGHAAVTMRDIVDESSKSEVTLYDRFESKRGLLVAHDSRDETEVRAE
ncbi:helix-turn-helix domain-containing protein [Haloprofundus halobius]|uniref:helix-turn-helix domain-containing protein n=1 Tax=Haloprofundus halobius TaxID=2876194 RepID=UPI001CCEE950|nr:helix-turn-helix domain-containing protein [Haloprofundus halobius]